MLSTYAVASAANARLVRGLVVQDLFPQHPVFSDVGTCEFTATEPVRRFLLFKRYQRRIIAETPEAWISIIATEGAKQVWVVRSQDYGFPLMVVQYGERSQDWVMGSSYSSVDRGKRNLTFRLTNLSLDGPKHVLPDLVALKDQLRERLDEIREFSSRYVDTQEYVPVFAHALTLLDAPMEHLNKDCYKKGLICPELYPLEGRQLFAAGIEASVFGGMGSFNDTTVAITPGEAVSSQKEKSALVERVAPVILQAPIMAVNSITSQFDSK